MKNSDLFNALSGIDSKYIDEAAYELHGKENVVDITSKSRIRRFVLVALPSVAAILLIVAVALPAVLRVSKSDSAATASEAPAASAAGSHSYNDTAMAESAEEAVAEAPAAAETEEAAPAATESADNAKTNDAQTLGPNADYDTTVEPKYDTEEEPLPAVETDNMEEAAEEAPAEPLVIKEADYSRDILIFRCEADVPESVLEERYILRRTDVDASKSKVSEGKLSELSGSISLTDNYIVVNMMDKPLEKGKYRILIGDAEAEFEVK